MDPFPASMAAPVVVRRGASSPEAPLVVLLHGRGSDEASMAQLVDHLPEGPAYAAVRAPIAEGAGFAWFANRGIGRPVRESLAATTAWFRDWLDTEAPTGRPVVLVGFSGGAAFAGGLLLADPRRYAGAAIIQGTLPWDIGLPTGEAHLAGVPVFVAQGEADTVIPRELLDRTWDYLLGPSGAPAYAVREPVGHGLTRQTVAHLAGWLAERLAFVAEHGLTAPAAPRPVGEQTLPRRAGPRPAVSWSIPQQQLTDTAPARLQEALHERVLAAPGVTSGQSAISVPGARGYFLTAGAAGPDEAFLVPQARELGHLHPAADGSLHLALPPATAAAAVERGWAVAHPLAGVRLTPGMVLVYGPRDEEELLVVERLVRASHAWACGASHELSEDR